MMSSFSLFLRSLFSSFSAVKPLILYLWIRIYFYFLIDVLSQNYICITISKRAVLHFSNTPCCACNIFAYHQIYLIPKFPHWSRGKEQRSTIVEGAHLVLEHVGQQLLEAGGTTDLVVHTRINCSTVGILSVLWPLIRSDPRFLSLQIISGKNKNILLI